jgi:organic radical activating enzyme
MCTANEGENYVKAAVDHGALGILAKPPTDESMKAIIRLIETQRQQAEPKAVAGGEPAVAPALSEEKIRALITETAQAQTAQLRETADTAARDAARQVVHEMLQPMVNSLVDRKLADIKPPEVDTKALREEVARQVNQDLQEFVRQINERTMESLIEASIYEQVQDLANDFSRRLQQLKEDILSQVPEKNDMIEHIRVVTEGTMEAHVRETATHVSQEIANSVATETVEQILDEQMADRTMLKAASDGAKRGRQVLWIGLLALAAVVGYGIHYLQLFN